MKLDIYQIDAFTDRIFGGNPACVVPLESWLPDDVLLKIANENAVAETAFFIVHDDHYKLRWFTPEIEMDLCGHATLATAHCLKSILKHTEDNYIFDTASGRLEVNVEDGLYHMDFPSRMPEKSELPAVILQSLNIAPMEVYKSRDYVLVYKTEEDIRKIEINRQIFDEINLDPGGVVVTSQGENCDFVSRFFTPQASILEDPVTGSAHSSLIPFWSDRLKRDKMEAIQLSERKGRLSCINKGNRVIISGNARTYFIGNIWTE